MTKYSLGHTQLEYDRLRAQARIWEHDTARLLDWIAVKPGASCLDAGCGPGETMRLMADRTGPHGRVVGIDVDARLAGVTESALREEGHGQCRVLVHDLTAAEPLMREAGLGAPDGTDVTGRVESLSSSRLMLEHAFRNLQPAAASHNIMTETEAAETLDLFADEVSRYPDRPFLWPLLNGAWKRKE